MGKPRIPKVLQMLPNSLEESGDFETSLLAKSPKIQEVEREHNKELEIITEFPGKAIVEITMNYPHTAAFKKLPASYQKLIYMRIYNNLKCVFGMYRYVPEESRIAFECYQSGQWHAHAKITYRTRPNYYIEGFIAEIVKMYLIQLPKKYQDYNDNLLHREFKRYRCPSCVIQYVDPVERPERVLEWETYMSKYKDRENL